MSAIQNTNTPFMPSLPGQDGKPAVATPDFMSALQAANQAAASAIASAAKKEPDGIMSGKEALTAALEGRTDEQSAGLAKNLTAFGAAIDRVSDSSIRSIEDVRNALRGLANVKVVDNLKSDDGRTFPAITTGDTIHVDSEVANDPEELAYVMREELPEVFYSQTFGKPSTGDFGMETNGRYMGVASEDDIVFLRSAEASDAVTLNGVAGETANPKPTKVRWAKKLTAQRKVDLDFGADDLFDILAHRKLPRIRADTSTAVVLGTNNIVRILPRDVTDMFGNRLAIWKGDAAAVQFTSPLSKAQATRFAWDLKRHFTSSALNTRNPVIGETVYLDQDNWEIYASKNGVGNYTGIPAKKVIDFAKRTYGALPLA